MPATKLGLLLSTAPSDKTIETVVQLAEAAVRQGAEVYLYLIDEGVKSFTDRRFSHLLDGGVKMSVCAYGCQQHGVSTQQVDSRVALSGLVVLSSIIEACDRFLAFT
jgi:sulfur relay (sulfurtransferase) complex TusBCD TusD component (DsrE family)